MNFLWETGLIFVAIMLALWVIRLYRSNITVYRWLAECQRDLHMQAARSERLHTFVSGLAQQTIRKGKGWTFEEVWVKRAREALQIEGAINIIDKPEGPA